MSGYTFLKERVGYSITLNRNWQILEMRLKKEGPPDHGIDLRHTVIWFTEMDRIYAWVETLDPAEAVKTILLLEHTGWTGIQGFVDERHIKLLKEGKVTFDPVTHKPIYKEGAARE